MVNDVEVELLLCLIIWKFKLMKTFSIDYVYEMWNNPPVELEHA